MEYETTYLCSHPHGHRTAAVADWAARRRRLHGAALL